MRCTKGVLWRLVMQTEMTKQYTSLEESSRKMPSVVCGKCAFAVCKFEKNSSNVRFAGKQTPPKIGLVAFVHIFGASAISAILSTQSKVI